MGKFTKWIAGGLGWAFFGPIGGLIGFAVGSAIDGQSTEGYRATVGQTTTGDFMVSLLVLVAAVMKADGKVVKSELDYVKEYFIRSFGKDSASEAVKLLRNILKQDIDVIGVSRQIKSRLDYSSRLQMMHFLYGIAKADGSIPQSEVNILNSIAANMGISAKDTESIMAMFVESTEAAYKILEITKDATDDEVKKAYRTMAKKYHPDKVAYLGEDVKKAANEKFRKVNDAYESIKRERGMN
jgi:DnaJ like chaperone protein